MLKPLSLQSNTTHEITQQISRKLLRMDVLTFETYWALNNEIIKLVTSSWSILFNYCDIRLVMSAGCYICTHSIVFVTRFDSAMRAGMRPVCVCVVYNLAIRIRVMVTMVAAFYSLRYCRTNHKKKKRNSLVYRLPIIDCANWKNYIHLIWRIQCSYCFYWRHIQRF